MTQDQLIRQLKELREVRPRQDWVLLTKSRILAEEQKTREFSIFPLFHYKLAWAPIVSVFIIIGLFGFAANTVPGDMLFTVKKMTENAQVTFSSAIERPTASLKLANKRLEDLSKIAENNQVRNLDPAIKEFQANVDQAIKNLAEIGTNVTSSDPVALQEIVSESQKLEENKEKVEAVLGTIIGNTEELTSALTILEKQTANYLIADLENRTLSEENQSLLNEAKQDFESGDYDRALEKIWLLSNKP